jgi:hypothetical protein
MDLILEVVLKCCLLSVTSIYTRHCASFQNLPMVILSVKKTLGDMGRKNGKRVALYFGEVRGGEVLGVECGVNAIILLGGSQASPDRPSDHNSTKKKSLHCLETGAQDLDCAVNVK